MGLLTLFLIGLGLAMDCFAVSLSLGAAGKLTGRTLFRTALLFGLFQGIMPVIGWLVGENLRFLIEKVDHWIAFGILFLIGGKMIAESFGKESDSGKADLQNLYVVLGLSLATSIDALITGVGFGLIKVNILLAALIIGGVTFLLTLAGAYLGKKSTFITPRWAERLGGVVLIGIGIKVVLMHIM
jgi:putative Mn2+ efflux pump MntP